MRYNFQPCSCSTALEYPSELECLSELNVQAPCLALAVPAQLGVSMGMCAAHGKCSHLGTWPPLTPPESQGLQTLGPQPQRGCMGCPVLPCVPEIPMHPHGGWFPTTRPCPWHHGVPILVPHQMPSGTPAPARWHIYISSPISGANCLGL